jgi:molybdopterin-containing oxidoreductase family membrane subunit
MWIAALFATVSLILLIVPSARRKEGILLLACISVVISTWIDKGFGLVVGGFIPNPFERVVEYWPTISEICISIGVWATGFLIITILYKITVSVKEEAAV